MRASRRLLLILLLLLPATGLVAGARDAGLLLDLDAQHFLLTARDLRAGVTGPTLPVVMGSPAHPTPTGLFPVYDVVRNPGWKPGAIARGWGAHPMPPSSHGPLGVGKITFARGGVALHGGADPLLLGKPVSLGCVRTRDQDFLTLVEWLDERGGLGPEHPDAEGEIRQAFRRPAHIRVH